MSLPEASAGYSLGRDEGEALWFNGGLGVIKASRELTAGAFGALGLLAPKGFAAPLHVHSHEDEFFVVLDGEVRLQHGETVVEATTGSIVYGPRGVPHSFRVDSDEARMLLFFGPGGVEGFFRDAGKPAGSRSLPPPGEVFLDRDGMMEVAGRYGQEFVGPPLPERP